MFGKTGVKKSYFDQVEGDDVEKLPLVKSICAMNDDYDALCLILLDFKIFFHFAGIFFFIWYLPRG